jgi:hypothetical protein
MTFAEYHIMDPEEQYIAWLAFAKEVAAYQKAGVLHVLYQLDEFYIELNAFIDQNKNAWFNVFSNSWLLEPYLERIEIDI